jgi:hypothetical protein
MLFPLIQRCFCATHTHITFLAPNPSQVPTSLCSNWTYPSLYCLKTKTTQPNLVLSSFLYIFSMKSNCHLTWIEKKEFSPSTGRGHGHEEVTDVHSEKSLKPGSFLQPCPPRGCYTPPPIFSAMKQ